MHSVPIRPAVTRPQLPRPALGAAIQFARVASGARIAWAASGRGPPVVRVAHWMTHVERDPESAIWQPWLQRLQAHVQLLRYDGRGCGVSGIDATAPSLEASLEELVAVVDASGHARVALLGMSGAGPVAIAFAQRFPERVSHLVLHGSYTCGLMHRSPTPEQLQMFEATVKLMELGWGRPDAAVQQFMTTTFMPDCTPEQAAAFTLQQRLSCDGARAAALYRSLTRLDVRDLLTGVQCPTLVTHCAGDAVAPIELGRTLAAQIEGARFETLASRNHIPLAGEPAFERFCTVLADFVATPAASGLERFTLRELALLKLVAQGHDNLQIAAHLGVTDKTVRNSLSRLYTKLEVEGRPKAIVRAREMGLD